MWLLVKNNSSNFRPTWDNNGMSLLSPLFSITMKLALANSKKVLTRNFGCTTTSQNKSFKANTWKICQDLHLQKSTPRGD